MSTYEISKSSLLSLKAEILRKQEELNTAKLQNKTKIKLPKKATPLEIKNKGIEQRESNDYVEDEDVLAKSRSALEYKSKLYEKLSKRSKFSDEEIEHNRRFLVRFDKKNRRYSTDVPPEGSDDEDKFPESDEDRNVSEEYEPAKNPDEEWVEYVDCLGRTRKCMRKDLEFLKEKDKELRASVDKNRNKSEQLYTPETNDDKSTNKDVVTENEFTESSELLSNDMRREILRQQWENEEAELRNKDDIHYQDILFNEARTHGVGYYGFSKDEEERARQQAALKNLRKETEEQQKKAQDIRALREKQLAARAKAARNRKRARMGLPPEEDEPEVAKPAENVVINEEEIRLKNEQEEKEKEKEAARKKHIRPWDIGKDGVRKHYEYTQEEWVDKKRKERPQEFAPPSTYKKNVKYSSEDEETETNKTLYFSSKKQTANGRSKPDKKVHYRRNSDVSETDEVPSINPYKPPSTSNSTPFKPVPIVNECEDFDEQDQLLSDYLACESSKGSESRGKGIEIEPPATYEYYGPSSVKRPKFTGKNENLEESISAGLKFLRQQSEKKNTSIKHPSEMFLS